MKFRVCALAFALLLSTFAVAEDAPKKKGKKARAGRNNQVAAVMGQLKDVGLTDEQKTKIEELAKKMAEEAKKLRDDAGLSADVMKKRTEVMKKLKESGKSQKELLEAANKEAGLTEAQASALKKANGLRTEMLKGAVALLTDEQKEKLPERLTRLAKQKKRGEKAKGKGKGKKKEEATS